MVSMASSRHHTQFPINFEARVAILDAGIKPGNDEDGEALARQKLDERVLWSEVENLVLHDPSRDEEYRLGMHLFGRRLVLDQLNQVISIDDLARRDGNGLADAE